ncbi:SGNH/GDSL hydrolase family protein [Vibrio rhodolitus]|uniref:SGNH/GDSL hydrolase family protein n=1 Tax=Vibrio rhodolitus TaxID=2231649 RepID=UPI000E0C02F5|nr:SGNH/GDSL hydrolase family protein [Vibrio rhodolitus]
MKKVILIFLIGSIFGCNSELSTSPSSEDHSDIPTSISIVNAHDINVDQISFPRIGSSNYLRAIANYDDGSVEDITSIAEWNSSSDSIVMNKGLVTVKSQAAAGADVSVYFRGITSEAVIIDVESNEIFPHICSYDFNDSEDMNENLNCLKTIKLSDGSIYISGPSVSLANSLGFTNESQSEINPGLKTYSGNFGGQVSFTRQGGDLYQRNSQADNWCNYLNENKVLGVDNWRLGTVKGYLSVIKESDLTSLGWNPKVRGVHTSEVNHENNEVMAVFLEKPLNNDQVIDVNRNTQLYSICEYRVNEIVVIGDSISAGFPNDSRLTINKTVVANNLDNNPKYGQLAYGLLHQTGSFVYNHGISGQTSSQVKERWGRDVLGIDGVYGDALGSTRTLPKKPVLVFVHVGTNDIKNNVPNEIIQENYEFFAESARSNSIKLVMANIGARSSFNAEQGRNATAINTWISEVFKKEYPEVEVVDYMNWSTDGTNDPLEPDTTIIKDTVHPTADGQAEYSTLIYEHIKRSGAPAILK